MGCEKKTAKRQRSPRRENSLGVMDVVLIVVGISLFAFTIAMVKIYQECGGVPDTLVTCVFATLGGECGIMGWIKTTKERNKERRWEKEDKREAGDPLDKKTMEE